MPRILAAVTLQAELERIAVLAAARAARDGERVTAVLAAEPAAGRRVYLCALEDARGARSWLALDRDGGPVRSRRDVRDVVAILALCEIAEESAFPGDLDELQAQLVALRITEAPAGIEEAEEAALALQRTLAAPPQLATPERLDAIGAAARRLELALDPGAPSPFAAAMRAAQGAVDELTREVESSHRSELE